MMCRCGGERIQALTIPAGVAAEPTPQPMFWAVERLKPTGRAGCSATMMRAKGRLPSRLLSAK